MAEHYTGKRIVIVGGSLIALYAVHALAGAVLPISQALVDAAAGYGIGILVHKNWS